jgi:hypothetical protein
MVAMVSTLFLVIQKEWVPSCTNLIDGPTRRSERAEKKAQKEEKGKTIFG